VPHRMPRPRGSPEIRFTPAQEAFIVGDDVGRCRADSTSGSSSGSTSSTLAPQWFRIQASSPACKRTPARKRLTELLTLLIRRL
jgi:hypothetical protein